MNGQDMHRLLSVAGQALEDCPTSGIGEGLENIVHYSLHAGIITKQLLVCQRPHFDWCLVARVLEFDMCAQGWHDHGAAIAIVARVINILHAGCEINSTPDVRGVIKLDDVLAAVT